MAKHREMKDIIKNMQDAVETGDKEIAHSNADDLLLEAIRKLACEWYDPSQITKLIELYVKVGKWYS